ncbi:MAG TPA: type II toxin-antitoxin system VapC family toxin [Candidatus Limnocylindrales bacterium]|jgi:PIN domain nuclease of toxin-antitoxin system|nr:type II toxin-antitoxin system VapC family toxin [Candidatus Limnocylindrales bacterium]
MKYLLDTVIFLWNLHSPEKLNNKAQQLLASQHDEIFFSAVSSWEVVIKYARGKLMMPQPPWQILPEAITRFGALALPITHAHTLAVGQLPAHHSDPFDRMLIAQAQTEKMVLMTAEKLIEKYPVETFWCGK